jgi:4-carboxymuconolactone decarboxylase
MQTPRIPPLSDVGPVADRLARLLPAGMAAPQLFLTVARNAGHFNWMVDTGLLGPSGLADRKTLAPALRELLILRTCVATRNDYEFNLHVQTLSRRMGLSEAQIDDVRRQAPSGTLWSDAERAAMRLVDALVALHVDDEVHAKARRHFDDAALIEMTHLVGLYTGVAMIVALARPAFDRYRPGPPITTTS